MIDQEKAFNDLDIIKKVMSSCAQKQEYDGIHFKIWGLLIPGATFLNYILTYFDLVSNKLIWILWIAVMIFGISLSIYFAVKRRKANTRSMGSKLLTATWGSSWISIAVLMAAGIISPALTMNGIMMMIALILAGGFFISGTLSGKRMLKITAAGWWALSIVIIVVPISLAPIFLAAATFFLSFIPGLILDRDYRINTEQKTEIL